MRRFCFWRTGEQMTPGRGTQDLQAKCDGHSPASAPFCDRNQFPAVVFDCDGVVVDSTTLAPEDLQEADWIVRNHDEPARLLAARVDDDSLAQTGKAW